MCVFVYLYMYTFSFAFGATVLLLWRHDFVRIPLLGGWLANVVVEHMVDGPSIYF